MNYIINKNKRIFNSKFVAYNWHNLDSYIHATMKLWHTLPETSTYAPGFVISWLAYGPEWG